MFPALIDELGLTGPVVRGSEGAFLRTELRRNRDDHFSLTQGFIARKSNHVAPRGPQNRPVEPSLGAGAIAQKLAGGILFRFRKPSHVGDFEILKDVELIARLDEEAMTGLMRIFLPHLLFVPLSSRGFPIRFGAVARPSLPPGCSALPSLPYEGLGNASVPTDRALGELVCR